MALQSGSRDDYNDPRWHRDREGLAMLLEAARPDMIALGMFDQKDPNTPSSERSSSTNDAEIQMSYLASVLPGKLLHATPEYMCFHEKPAPSPDSESDQVKKRKLETESPERMNNSESKISEKNNVTEPQRPKKNKKKTESQSPKEKKSPLDSGEIRPEAKSKLILKLKLKNMKDLKLDKISDSASSNSSASAVANSQSESPPQSLGSQITPPSSSGEISDETVHRVGRRSKRKRKNTHNENC